MPMSALESNQIAAECAHVTRSVTKGPWIKFPGIFFI